MSTEWRDRISDDERSHPKLRASGLPVEAILNALAEGWSRERILDSHPALSEDDLRACIAYAAESIRKKILLRKIGEGIAAAEAGDFVSDEELDAEFGPLGDDDE